jgi:uncharacterized protein with NRDE domain
MCLAAFEWRPNGDKDVIHGDRGTTADYGKNSNMTSLPSLLLVFNRDEYFNRPSQSASYWPDQPGIYAGRDLLAGGTWMATSTNFGQAPRLACVTNYDSLDDRKRTYPTSRGDIVSTFVGDGNKWSALEFANEYLQGRKDQYAGFNALLFDGTSMVYCSNRDPQQFCRELPAGVYGLSNHLLDTPWPKVEKVKRSLTTALKRYRSGGDNKCRLPDALVNQLFSDFEDPTPVEDRSLLPTTFGEDEEYLRSAVFVRTEVGGTRTTTIVSYLGGLGFDVVEKTHTTPFDEESSSREFLPMNDIKSKRSSMTAPLL